MRLRPPIKEHDIDPTPLPLNKLTPEGWEMALTGALGCLGAGGRGRATQKVRFLKGGQEVEKEVSPHLTFMKRLMYPASSEIGEWMTIMKEASEFMQPLYDFMKMRST